MVSLAVRSWVRYLVPFSLLSVVALSPVLYLTLKVAPPANVDTARAQLRLAWIFGGTAWVFQYWLVAGVAPAVRGLASGAALSQWRALWAGLANLVRAIVPTAIAVAAVVLGGVALVVPGLVLAVLVSLTGASTRLGDEAPAAVRHSVELVRGNLRTIAIVVLAIVALDLAITLGSQLALVPAFSKKTPAVKLEPIAELVRVVALALVVISPIVATSLAALATKKRA